MNQNWNRKDRRGSSRFPIARPMRFQVANRKGPDLPGRGETIDMSSTGVLFATDRELNPGRRIEVSISWPAQLNENCALKLVANGRVVRTEPGRAAVEIQQYEFRTVGPGGFST